MQYWFSKKYIFTKVSCKLYSQKYHVNYIHISCKLYSQKYHVNYIHKSIM